uniref:Uncharacterized protein n=1 Tax=Tanacetum cinerariifolium TaxID=118510 RepID=A0A6L2MZT1_TANCI|nr:hypothetical protein [Tanacetum cinerariifolium]
MIFSLPDLAIRQVACAKEPRTSFDELMDTYFDFSAFFLNWVNIKDLTQEILVGAAFELFKCTCKSLTELEYHLEECSKATTEPLYWHNPEGKVYPFDLCKLLLLIRDHQEFQIIPQDLFINNKLKYLKGRDLSKRYSSSVTKTKAATYEIKWIKDLDGIYAKEKMERFRQTKGSGYDYIDKKLYERRLMRNLEKFVGGREYGNDLRLLKRTI